MDNAAGDQMVWKGELRDDVLKEGAGPATNSGRWMQPYWPKRLAAYVTRAETGSRRGPAALSLGCEEMASGDDA